MRDEGWELVEVEGDHRQFKHPEKPGKVTVAGQRNEELQEGTWKSIQRQAGWERQTAQRGRKGRGR